jgi:predicted nuclease of restriction endonuclease-like RecB superfamily
MKEMFPRNLLKFKIKKGLMHPLFLKEDNYEHYLLAEKALSFFKKNIGKEKSQIDIQELYYEVGDDKLAGAFAYAIEHIYAYKPKPLKAIKKSPLNLRLKLFELAGSVPPGFAIERSDFLLALKKIEGINLSLKELDEYLWSDDPKGYILSEGKENASPEKLIECYNFEVLDTLLANSTLISFSTLGSEAMPKGTFAKNLIKHVKNLGLIYEGRLEKDKVAIDVYGPISLFGRPTKFAWRLSALFHKALPILKSTKSWFIKIIVRLRKREAPFLIINEDLPKFKIKDFKVKPLFDSRVEESFYKIMSSVSKYHVIREAEPLIFKDALIVPDFLFERKDGVKWYLEIIGFWRPEYTFKKKAKLMELKKTGLKNFIILVDSKYWRYFKDLDYPIFTYKIKGNKLDAPYGKIINLILS